MAQGTPQPRQRLPPCENCKKPFQIGQVILTSVSCGHSFHQTIECVEDLDGYQRFDRVEVFTGGCRLNGCEYDGNLVRNSSEASPTTLLFRNRPLENLVKAVCSPSRRSAVVPVVEIEVPRSQKRDARKSGLPTSTSSGKRVRLDIPPNLPEESPVKSTALADIEDRMQESISALELPPFTQTDESDADDDEEVIAGLIAASQALKQMPNKDESATYDEDLSLEEKENLSEKPFSRSDSDTEESEEEPPPDPYGMPPLSQWRRSSKRG